uniref:ATP synthase F0 subunit 8 n=1 Tax=Mesaphorura yosii TaxID=1840514 RepID=A0A6H0EWR8_9HEXA|nr:ATP synthase F0 subunit 8 [Mesaphorura yosii]
MFPMNWLLLFYFIFFMFMIFITKLFFYLTPNHMSNPSTPKYLDIENKWMW